MDGRFVKISGKLVVVPEVSARQFSTVEIHGVQTDQQLYVLWKTIHMHQTSVKVRVSALSSEVDGTKVGVH